MEQPRFRRSAALSAVGGPAIRGVAAGVTVWFA
jgi:hypothetical protein